MLLGGAASIVDRDPQITSCLHAVDCHCLRTIKSRVRWQQMSTAVERHATADRNVTNTLSRAQHFKRVTAVLESPCTRICPSRGRFIRSLAEPWKIDPVVSSYGVVCFIAENC